MKKNILNFGNASITWQLMNRKSAFKQDQSGLHADIQERSGKKVLEKIEEKEMLSFQNQHDFKTVLYQSRRVQSDDLRLLEMPQAIHSLISHLLLFIFTKPTFVIILFMEMLE